MEIKPLNDTSTIKFSAPVQQAPLNKKVIKDPDGIISNGIYKVIRWEKVRQIYTVSISGAILLAMSILIILYATTFKTAWIGFVPPIIIGLYSLYKFAVTLVERSAFSKSVIKYKEDLRIGVAHNPPFIVRMYSGLHKKQVNHNWMTFITLFYGGILTLLLWALKDVHWWIFKFDKWIADIFHNPNLMQWVFALSLLAVALIHIVFTIQRKKRILEIDSYFGANVVSKVDLEAEKNSRNKAWRRGFILSVMIILVIPIVVRWILKVVRRKK